MHIIKSLYGLIVAVLLLTSCTNTYYYLPHVQQTPLFKEKNEARLALSTGASNSGRAFTLFQGAYSVTNHIGITASYMRDEFTQKNTYSSGWLLGYSKGQKWRYHQYEIGAGYYKPLQEGFVFETYGGGGMAEITDNSEYYFSSQNQYVNGKYRVQYQQYYLQPAIGYTNEYVDVSLSTRLMARKLWNNWHNNLTEPEAITELDMLPKRQVDLFIEPALTLRTGYRFIKLHTQLTRSLALQPDSYQRQTWLLSVGLIGLIGQKWAD